jgi:hypothetical protein
MGKNGTWFRRLFKTVWAPGREEMLIAVAEDTSVHEYSRWSALSSLAVADTPRTRDYLVGRLARERGPGLYMCAAESLATLSEPRGAGYVDQRIFEQRWGGVRSRIFVALSKMDPIVAERFLIDYVRDPFEKDLRPERGYPSLVTAFVVLKRIDPEAARREAEALTRGPRGEELEKALKPFLQ